MSSITDSDTENNTINQIGRYLQQLVQHVKYEDWLFIFGTVIASNMETLNSNANKDYDFYNFAPVYKVYDPEKTSSEGMRFLSPKHYINHFDFLKATRRTTDIPDPHLSSAWYNNKAWHEFRTFLEENEYTMIDESFFPWMTLFSLWKFVSITLKELRNLILLKISCHKTICQQEETDNCHKLHIPIPRFH